ncbi:MAG TPA: T9SS type A sorting domain-containing protein [Candidatus Cloacimonadota bacterium]|nr:T9SS type A sorting domain-containing protein [Candidatus Cloacimonadota bacterium]HQB41115.1 T9SS type A sorting domain-containing protein [Candidatus Cloacimonadota bacterium]
MKRIIFCIAYFTLTILSLYARIDSIDNINLDSIVVDFGDYRFAINQYDDRLYVENYQRIGEYQIYEDGSIALKYIIEKYNNPPIFSSFIIGDKLYYAEAENDITFGQILLSIADVSQSPLQSILTRNTGIYAGYTVSKGLYDDYLLLGDDENYKGRKYNSHTLEEEGQIWDAYGFFTLADSTFIQCGSITGGGYNMTVLWFFNLNEVESDELPEHFAEYILSDDEILSLSHIKYENELLYIMGYRYMEVIDLSDINNPVSIYKDDITGAPDFWHYTDAILIDDILFTNNAWGDIIVFNINTSEIIYEEDTIYGNSLFGCLNLDYPYIYSNNTLYISQYELGSGITKIQDYGLWNNRCRQKDSNIVAWDAANDTIYFYPSLLEDYYTTCIEGVDYFINFEVYNEKLYLFLRLDNNQYVIDVYSLDNEQLESLYRINVDQGLHTINIVDDFLYISTSNSSIDQYIVYVYRLIGDSIEYYCTFNGKIQDFRSHKNDSMIAVCNLGNIDFRDRYAPEDIVFTYSFQPANGNNMPSFMFVDEDHFMIYDYPPGYASVYRVSDSGLEFLYTQNFDSCYTTLNAFNGLLTKSIENPRQKTIYSIGDYEFHEAGEYEALPFTKEFFYPEYNKMLKYSSEGAFLYSFDYTVASDDHTIVKPKAISAYPNPCISGNVHFKAQQVKSISIYNIKGQLVKKIEANPETNKEIIWDKKDQNQQNVASGIYFYRVEQGQDAQIGKLMILK